MEKIILPTVWTHTLVNEINEFDSLIDYLKDEDNQLLVNLSYRNLIKTIDNYIINWLKDTVRTEIGLIYFDSEEVEVKIDKKTVTYSASRILHKEALFDTFSPVFIDHIKLNMNLVLLVEDIKSTVDKTQINIITNICDLVPELRSILANSEYKIERYGAYTSQLNCMHDTVIASVFKEILYNDLIGMNYIVHPKYTPLLTDEVLKNPLYQKILGEVKYK